MVFRRMHALHLLRCHVVLIQGFLFCFFCFLPVGLMYFPSVRIKFYTLERPKKKRKDKQNSPMEQPFSTCFSVHSDYVKTCATFTVSTSTKAWKSKGKFLPFHFRHFKSFLFFKSVKTGYFFLNLWLEKEKKDICFRIEGRKIDPDWVGKTSTENTVEQRIQMFMSRTRGRHIERKMLSETESLWETEWVKQSDIWFFFDFSVVLLFCFYFVVQQICLNFHGFLSRRGIQKLS